MSFAEIKEALPALTESERAELQEHLDALQEGISVEELRAMNAAIDEELNDPSEELSPEEVEKNLHSLKLNDGV